MPKNTAGGYLLRGLSDGEAARSREKHGSNEIPRKNKTGFFRQYLASFGDPIIKILLIALFVNVLIMFRDINWYETAGIALAVLLATLVSTVSEYGSENAFEKLQEEAARIKCRVRRSGEVREIPVGEAAVGDVVLLQAGERIPADGIIVSGELSVDQSALNGESKEAVKRPGEFSREKSGEGFMAPDRLFRGSVICSGEGVMMVCAVGEKTYYGGLASEIQEEKIESPLKARLAHLAKVISRLGYVSAAVVALANVFDNIVIDNGFNPALISEYLRHTPWLLRDLTRSVTLGITVIVMAVPEGLPMMITLVLSANMRKMLKDNVLVRKLVGIETSGSLNILFTDKTGTLTKGKLEASVFVDGSGNAFPAAGLKKYPRLLEPVMRACAFNNSAFAGAPEETRKGAWAGGTRAERKVPRARAVGGNSTDRALLSFAAENGFDVNSGCQKGRVFPFNSNYKMSVTEVMGMDGQAPGESLFLLKGAPESLLPYCETRIGADGEKAPIRSLRDVYDTIDGLAGDSVRIIALCASEKPVEPGKLGPLTLYGLIGLKDELRPGARKAVAEVIGAGVQVVMITGDNRETAVSVARTAGLLGENPGENSVLSSERLKNMDDGEVKEILRDIRVVSRAMPADKSRLVRLSQETGLVAGMTGDGVNDAPALKKADVGFAMGDGTEIAKEAGDIVIMDNDFSSIVKAVLYGRTIFKSIRKFLIFQLTVNLCAVGVSIIAPFLGIEAPVTIIQMLWINMIMDTLAGLAYAGEAPLPEYMREAPKRRDEKIINRYMYSQIVFTGLYTTLLCLLFLKLPMARAFFRPGEKYVMTAFFALFIFAGIFNSFSARTHRLNLLSHLAKNKAFIIVMGIVMAIQVLMVYFGGDVFRTTGLLPGELAVVVGLAASVIAADIGRKIILRMNKRKGFI